MRVVDYLSRETREIAGRVTRLELQGYDDQDLGRAARDCAAVWERSLKASDPAWAAARATLHRMTEDLRSRGWTAADALDTVRLAANADKHEAAPAHALSELLQAFEGLAAGSGDLEQLAPGSVAEMPEQARRRRMFCAVYDYFHAGETEYSFLAASPDQTWRTVHEVDAFQVESRHSGNIEAALSRFEGWTLNPPDFDSLAASLRESDGELSLIASFTGSYEDVLRVLGPYQHSMPLLSGLHREDQLSHLVASAVHAFGDGLAGPQTTTRNQSSADRIYARVTSLLQDIPEDIGALRLDRCDEDGFRIASAEAIRVDDALGIAVRPNGLVLVRG